MQNTENTPRTYTTLDDVIAAEIAPLDTDWAEGQRLDQKGLAHDLTEWVEVRNEAGQVLANHSGFVVKEDYRPIEGDDEHTAFWELVESHMLPFPDVQEQTLTGTDVDGSTWEVEVEWRPQPAVGLDATADQNGRTAILWAEDAPVFIGNDRAMHGSAVLVERVESLSGDVAMTFSPLRVTDLGAELEPGEYRILSSTQDEMEADLPVIGQGEYNG